SALCFDGTNLWVAETDANTVTQVRATDGAILNTYGVPAGPVALAYDGVNVWVASKIAGSVTALRAADGSGVTTFNVDSPTALVGDRFAMGVGTSLGLFHMNPSDGQIITDNRFIRVSALGYDGSGVWATDESGRIKGYLKVVGTQYVVNFSAGTVAGPTS